MGCCGKKRAEWLTGTKSPSVSMISENSDIRHLKEYPTRVFEYTGGQNLIVKGIYSGIIYHFRHPGQKIEVAYEDSFALMAEINLKHCR